MTAFKSAISTLTLGVFLFFALPAPLFHELFHHEEACNTVHGLAGDVQVSTGHEHCQLLELNTPPLFLSADEYYFSVSEPLSLSQAESVRGITSPPTIPFYLRGPPSAFC